MQTLIYVVGTDKRALVSDVQNFQINWSTETSYNWVQARQYENSMRQVFVNVRNANNTPFDLTGCNIWFEGLLPDDTHRILDAKHATVIDAQSGQFRFDFPAQAFAVAGSYKQAFFRIVRDGMSVTTLEFDLEVLADKVISGVVATDYITPFEDLYSQLEEILTNSDGNLQAKLTEWTQEYNAKVQELTALGTSVTNSLTEVDNRLATLEEKIEQDGLFTQGEADDLKVAIRQKTTNIFDTVEDMRSASFLTAGMAAKTLGYHAVGDGGGAFYKISTTPPTNFYEEVNSALYAELLPDLNWNVKQLGAYGDGTHDDTEALQKAIELTNETLIPAYIPTGKYKITESLGELKKGKLQGDYTNTTYQEGGSVILDDRTPLGSAIPENSENFPDSFLLRVIDGGHVTLENLTFSSGGLKNGIIFKNSGWDAYVRRITMLQYKGAGMYFGSGAMDIVVDSLTMISCGGDENVNSGSYALELTGNANALKFSNLHIEHCRLALRGRSVQSSQFTNCKIEQSTAGIAYSNLSSVYFVDSGLIDFVNCNFVCITKEAYSSNGLTPLYFFKVENNSVFSSNRPTVAFNACTFANGLGSGSASIESGLGALILHATRTSSVIINSCTFYDISKHNSIWLEGQSVMTSNIIQFNHGDEADGALITQQNGIFTGNQIDSDEVKLDLSLLSKDSGINFSTDGSRIESDLQKAKRTVLNNSETSSVTPQGSIQVVGGGTYTQGSTHYVYVKLKGIDANVSNFGIFGGIPLPSKYFESGCLKDGGKADDIAKVYYPQGVGTAYINLISGKSTDPDAIYTFWAVYN